MEQENIDAFYKLVADIEFLYKKDIINNLNSYFKIDLDGKIQWIKSIDKVIMDKVENAANKYLIK
jgi:hypothetical protein